MPATTSVTVCPDDAVPADRSPRPWDLPLVILAVIAIGIALVAGVRGLAGDPIVSSDRNGAAQLRGSFQPFPCPGELPRCVQGYIQSGARSVFVRFPEGCPAPTREQTVTVRAATLDAGLGKRGYLARDCASPG